MQEAANQLEQARRDSVLTTRDLTGIIARRVQQDRQRKWVMITAAIALGPGSSSRPSSGGCCRSAGRRMAATIMGGSLERRGCVDGSAKPGGLE